MRKPITTLLAIICITANAQGISNVDANIEVLPSTYYSNAAWSASTYIADYGVEAEWGNDYEVQGVPPTDGNGREWYEYSYSLTDADFSWQTTSAPYSSDEYYHGMQSTQWCQGDHTADIYIRRTFTIQSVNYTDLYLACGRDDGPSQYYINGTLVYSTDNKWNEAEYIKLTDEQKALLKTDGSENIMAVHVHNNYGGAYADCGLYGTELNGPWQLPMGYNETWTARVLFNSEGGYTGNYSNEESDIHGWEKLYEAQNGDVYTITMPTKALYNDYAKVQFKTPITLDATHKYRLKMSITANQGISGTSLSISENEDDASVLKSTEINLLANSTYYFSASNLTGTSINDAKLEFCFPTTEDNAVIKIENISLYDQTSKLELWKGTSFYNWCYYANPETGSRIKDMAIEGRKETLSWTKADFDDSQWQEAEMPIGNEGFMDEIKTIWPGVDNTNYWIRRTFNLDEVKSTTKYTLKVCHDDNYSIYVNGHLINTATGWTTGKNTDDSEIPSTYLQKGTNVIATYIQQNWGGKFYDCGIDTEENYYEEFDADADVTTLQINEVQVSNIDQYIDNSYNYGSWIEIYNPSDKRISLNGLYISDEPDNLMKFQLQASAGVIASKGFKTIFFGHNSADGNYGDKADRQVAFKLQNDGGTICLSDASGNIISQVDYPAGIARCSYARKNNTGTEWAMTGEPTPGESNASSTFADTRLDAPVVDVDSKLFTDGFTVNVTIPAGATLRYTTDGTAPTLTNGETSQTGLFTVAATTNYRFRLFKDGYLPSQVVTRSYIYKDNDYYLPVISITTNPDNLYDDTIGVYVDGTNGISGRNHGKSNLNMDWERPVNFEYITADGKMAVNMEAQFTISGGWSRHYAPAAFKIKATKNYEGINSISYPFFSTKPYNKYKQILVRNGGNDNDSQYHGRVRDAITQKTLLTSGIYCDAQDYQPTHVFFNGKYIGMLNLREPNNRYNGTANYGYDDDEMDAFEYSNGYYQMAGTRDAFNNWQKLSENAEDDDTYNTLRNEVVDMDEFINCWAAITYIGCSDWICNNNNLKGYRSTDGGKFHLTMLDQDWGWSNTNGVSQVNNNYSNEILAIYNNMKKNTNFQRQFIDAYSIMGGSVFTPERCEQQGDSICNLVAPALAFEGREPWYSFNEQKDKMIGESFRQERIEALRSSYGLGTGMNVSFSANIPQATFRINEQSVPTNKFDGTLFGPVAIEASAPAGYNFVGWEKMSSETGTPLQKGSQWSYYDEGSLDGTNWKTGSVNWETGYAPLGYGGHDFATTISYGDDSSNKTPTYYFRNDITLDRAPDSNSSINLNWTADDGFVVYVNGNEAYRYLMPDGDITFDTYSTTFAYSNPDSGTATLDASLFNKGKNIIAVEVHNVDAGSSDIYWDAEIQISGATNTATLSTERTITLDDEEDHTLKAIFEPLSDQCLIAAGSTPVVINEVSAANSIFVNDYGKRNDWIELYNTTSEDIDVSGMYISDNINKPQKYQITSGNTETSTVIPAHGYLIIWADKLDPMNQLHSSFKLGNDDEASVVLTAEDSSWSDTITYMSHTGEESVGRYPDGGKRIYKMTKPTINAANMLNTYAQWISGEDTNFDEERYITGVSNTSVYRTQGTEYFSIDGMRLNAPQKGLNIVRKTNADGTITTRRIIVR